MEDMSRICHIYVDLVRAGLKMKKIDEFHPDRRQNLPESDNFVFNQLSESEAASASSLNVSAVSKKKIMQSRRKQCY